ncbi:hypothetical protein BDA99DRAFT_520193 [Phascolomyces articulosus]|uniref:Uncharacterized protein n=1 Tax=Phascolomyces articulosus TaxID=60185 RepID=A0AAD5PAM2_9FUNG|nr:hypothetical protein BDA99DRAFT_520193 [Phascolomyces articulosus]
MSSLFAEQQSNFLTPHQGRRRRQSSGVRRSSVDIHGQTVTPDILVALLDRPNEMRILASRNPHFYEALENYITETQGLDAWVKFQDIIYTPREDLPDRDWVTAVGHFLRHNPVFFTKFKESVGYFDNDEEEIRSDISEEEEDEIATSSGGEDEFHTLLRDRGAPEHHHNNNHHDEFNEDSPPPRRKSSHMMHPALVFGSHPTSTTPIKEIGGGGQQRRRSSTKKATSYFPAQPPVKSILIKIREYPDIQERIDLMCPAFFHKVQQRMACPPTSKLSSAARRNSILDDTTILEEAEENGEENHPRFSFCDQEETFKHFKDAVCTTRREQPDDQAWVHSVVESLDGYPELLDNLKEIAASLDDYHH